MDSTSLVARAQHVLGYAFSNPDLIITALTHSSVADSRVKSNERLEFLGDAILGTAVCEALYRQFEDWLEGDLTKVKSVVVSRKICAEVSDRIGLTELLILGNGIDVRHNLPTSLKAAVYESVVGAVFLDGGFEPARQFVLQSMGPSIEQCAASENHNNFKSALQQFAQRHFFASPQYEALDEQGPDHSKCFEVCVVIGPERFPSAWGPSKKEAEQEAARRALEILSHGATVRPPP